MKEKNYYLIIAPSWIGDLVMSQSLYRLLKEKDPEGLIDVVAPKSTIDLLAFMPEINQAILAPFPRKKLFLGQRRQFGFSLRDKKYTHSIILPNSWKSALVPFFAKIKKRIGFKGESRYLLLNDLRKLDKEKLPTMIERFCALGVKKNEFLTKKLPWPKLEINQALIAKINSAFNFDSQVYDKLIAFCPGAEYGIAKRWPSHYFAEAAFLLAEKGYQIVLLGGPNDCDVSDQIVSEFKRRDISSRLSGSLINLVAKTDINAVVGILSQVKGVLTNDTGLMHIANAFEKPTLVIYGSSSDSFTPPLNHRASSIYLDLDCRPCFKRTCPLGHMNCLNQLTPKMVLAKFKKMVLKED